MSEQNKTETPDQVLTVDFRKWAVGRVVFRTQDGITKKCRKCGEVGAVVSYIPKTIVHVAGWVKLANDTAKLRCIAGCNA